MSIIEQIKAKVERLNKDASRHGYALTNEYFNKLLSFISTLESEKPIIPNDFDKAAKEYAKTTFKKPYSDNPDEDVTLIEPDKYTGFIAGAKWDRGQMMKDAISCKVFLHDGDLLLDYTQEQQDNALERIGANIGDKVRIIIIKED